MTEPIQRIAETVSGAVLRGAVQWTQPVRLQGRPRASGSSQHEHGTRSMSEEASAPEIPDSAGVAAGQFLLDEMQTLSRQAGFKEGWEQGVKEGHEFGKQEGAVAARHEVLAQAADVIAEAAQKAALDAAQKMTAKLEQESLQRWNQQKLRLDDLLAALPHQIVQRIEATQDDVLALCMETLVQVLGRTAAQPEAILSLVRQAMRQVKARPLISIELNQDDLSALKSFPGWQQWCDQHAAGVQWVASEQVQTGGCLLNSPQGSLDARLEIQLKSFAELLLASRDEAADETGRNHSASPGARA